MRATLNIVFGCLLLWMQAMVAVSPHTVTEVAPCRCCACRNQACSVPQNVPTPTPSPIAAQRLTSETERVMAPTQAAAKPELRADRPSIVPKAIVSIPPASQPLYQRHCALLI